MLGKPPVPAVSSLRQTIKGPHYLENLVDPKLELWHGPYVESSGDAFRSLYIGLRDVLGPEMEAQDSCQGY